MGCGWLGFPLAESLVASNYTVRGSTTSSEKYKLLRKQGIEPHLITLFETTIEGNITSFLQNLDVLILNIPPKLRGGSNENYVNKIKLLHQKVLQYEVRKIIFVSSTSIYGNVAGEVNEATLPKPSTASGEQLLAAEKIFRNDTTLNTTIIRFGGLIGHDRHPINMLSGRKSLTNGNAPVNLIHRKDCIRIITAVISKSWWNEIINGVYPIHPSKKEYYTKLAKERGLPAPHYSEENSKKGKIVHANTLLNVKNFKFNTSP